MMHKLWLVARSVLAVLLGIVSMTAVAFAVEIPLAYLALTYFPSFFPDRASLDSSPAWMLSQSLYTMPALVLGGYVAAWLAPTRGLAHAIAMAAIQELLIVLLIFNPPHPVPPWMWAISLLLAPLAIIFGGYLRTRGRQSPIVTNGSRPVHARHLRD